MTELSGLRGAIVWALVAFQPEAPFELDGRSYDNANEVASAMHDGRLPRVATLQLQAKLRPVVLLQDRPRGALPEFAALKLTRLTKLSETARQQARTGEARAHVYLGERAGLRHESVIDLNSILRIHRSAIAAGPVGHLDDNEIGEVGRRLATYLDVDLEAAIAERVATQWARLVAARRAARRD